MLNEPVIILVSISFLIDQVLAVLHIFIILNPVIKWLLKELLQVELLTVKFPYIIFLSALLKVRDQRDKFLIFWVFFE